MRTMNLIMRTWLEEEPRVKDLGGTARLVSSLYFFE